MSVLRDRIAGVVWSLCPDHANEKTCKTCRLRINALTSALEPMVADERRRAEANKAAVAAVDRVRTLADEAIRAWKPERDYHQERAGRKGYSHDEAVAQAYGRAIEALTEIRAALDQEETP